MDKQEQQNTLSAEAEERLSKLIKLDEKLKDIDAGVLEVEKHIIDQMKKEAGPSNLKLLAEALAIVRTLERRST